MWPAYETEFETPALNGRIGSLNMLPLSITARYIEVKVEHYLLFMLSPTKISWTILEIKFFFEVFVFYVFSKALNSKNILVNRELKNSENTLMYSTYLGLKYLIFYYFQIRIM